MQPIRVIKVGGNELDDPAFLTGLVQTLGTLATSPVLVHGGGKEITIALERYGQEVRFHDGLRITPPASMDVMEMVVCGRINKRLIARLVQHGTLALGLSGVDLGLLRCVPLRPDGIDLGRVGVITQVDVAHLTLLLAQGWLPVIAPVALGADDGLSYNVNADHVALAIASALAQAAPATRVELVFVSNVPGVLIEGHVQPVLDSTLVEQYIQQHIIVGGMVPKVRSALAALESGVATVRIANLAGLYSGGTQVSQSL
jgi:acetylglutamate kinase